MDFPGLLRRVDGSRTFEVELKQDHPLLADHRVNGYRVLPGVACIDLALSAMAAYAPEQVIRAFEDCVWLRPSICSEQTLRLRIDLSPIPDDRFFFKMTDREGTLASGVMAVVPMFSAPWPAAGTIWREVVESSLERLNRRAIYEAFSKMGIDYGPYFRRIHYADIHQNRAVALLSDNDAVRISLCNLLDCSFQSGMAISIGRETASLMPFSLGALVLHAPIDRLSSRSFYAVTEKTTQYRTNIGIHDEDGAPVSSIIDLGVKPSRLRDERLSMETPT